MGAKIKNPNKFLGLQIKPQKSHAKSQNTMQSIQSSPSLGIQNTPPPLAPSTMTVAWYHLTFKGIVLINPNLFNPQFFIGWWIMIDAAATKTFEPAYHTPGVISSVAVFM